MSLSSSLNSHYEKFIATGEVKCIDEEIPFEIPEGWEWTRLRNIVFSHGQRVPSAKFSYIDIGSIDNKNQCLNTSENIIEPQNAPSRARRIVESGDILYSTVRPYLHNMCIVDKQFSYTPIASTGLAVLACHTGLCNRFLFIYLQSPQFDLYANDGDNAKGVAYPAINDEKLYAAFVPVPPFSEQQRIISKIQNLKSPVDRYRKSQEELDQLNSNIPTLLKKSILQEAIQGRLVPRDPSDEPASELLKRIREEKQKLVKEGKLKKKDITDSVIFKGDDNRHYEKIGGQIIDISEDIPFDIPDSWQWTRLGYIANMFTGNSISDTEKRTKYTYVNGMEYIGTKDVGFDNRINYCNGISIPSDYLSEFKIAPENSILMCIEGGSAGKKIALTSQKVCFGNKLCCVDPYADTLVKFVYFYLQTPSFFAFFFGNITGIIGGVSVNNLKKILIPIPPIKEQARMIKQLEQLFKQLH